MGPSSHISWYYPNELTTYVHIKTCAEILVALLLVITKNRKQPEYLLHSEWVHNQQPSIRCGAAHQ